MDATASIAALKKVIIDSQALTSAYLSPTHPNWTFVYMKRVLGDDETLREIDYCEQRALTLVMARHSPPIRCNDPCSYPPLPIPLPSSPQDALPVSASRSPQPAPLLASGQRVTLNGLANSAWLNGSEGEVALFDASRGRYNVRVLAPRDAVERCNGMAWLRPENLKVKGETLEAVEYGKEWKDEHGVVCKKNTEFGRLCPRSHVLIKHDKRSALCSACGLGSAGAMWQCRESCNYRVCDNCHLLLEAQRLQPPPPPSDITHSDGANVSFPVLVIRMPFFQMYRIFDRLTDETPQGISLDGLRRFKRKWLHMYQRPLYNSEFFCTLLTFLCPQLQGSHYLPKLRGAHTPFNKRPPLQSVRCSSGRP